VGKRLDGVKVEKQKILITVTKEMKEKYNQLADETGATLSGYVAIVLKMYLDGLEASKKTGNIAEILKDIISKQTENKE